MAIFVFGGYRDDGGDLELAAGYMAELEGRTEDGGEDRDQLVCVVLQGGGLSKLVSRQTPVTTKHVFWRDKSMIVATKPLWRQNYVCRDKHVLSRQTRVSSRQTRICHDKSMLVVLVCMLKAGLTIRRKNRSKL